MRTAKGVKKSGLVELLAKYYDDPVGYARDVVGYSPTPQQQQLMEGVSKYTHVTARSGHGVGKSRAIGTLAWWFLTTRPYPIIPATAPSSHQLFDILWKELMWVRDRLPDVLRDSFEVSSTRIWHKTAKEQWYLQARTARRDKPEALQGFHGEHLLMLIEEAGGVDNEIFETVEGALTEADNRIVMVGNPTRTGGYFYDSHNMHKDEWYTLVFSSLDSPLYNKNQAAKLARRYGTDSSVYRVRVLGEFPNAEPDQLIPIDALMACVGLKFEEMNPMRVWALDVARYGDDETVLAKRVGRTILPLRAFSKISTAVLTKAIAAEYRATPDREKPKTIVVDTVGVGGGVYDSLEAMGIPVTEFQSSFASSDRTQWADAKTEIYFKFRDLVVDRRLSLPEFDSDGEVEMELIAQAASAKIGFAVERGGHTAQKVVSKREMRDQFRIPSPDRFEAAAMTLYEEGFTDFADDPDDEFWSPKKTVANGYDYNEFGRFSHAGSLVGNAGMFEVPRCGRFQLRNGIYS